MYTYKITNKVTGNVYVGQRSAYNGKPEDDTQYWGSSNLLHKLRSEHPQNWVKEIISVHTMRVELDAAEYALIGEHWGHPLLLNRNRNAGHTCL
ncbi:MAG: hypothetical protein NTY70_19100 [Burkholderiales bacterium]|nr:hypothetical protein [Burkholderiales bacterium]